MNNSTPKTINQMLAASCQLFPDRPAMGFAFKTPLTYAEVLDRVCNLAAVLKDDGLKKGDRIAILAENSPNWGIAYLAIVRLGAIAVPILPDFLESDVHHILSESKVKALFTTQRQIEKIFEFDAKDLQRVITLDGYVCDTKLVVATPLNEYASTFSKLKKSFFTQIEQKALAVGEDDIASIIYTSGTSGHSKAVMLSHGNLTANVRSTNAACHVVGSDWTFLSILPMSHTYEFTIGFLFPMFKGARIVYAGKMPTPKILEQICREEKPSVMCIVPMIIEKIYKKRILTRIEGSKILKTVTRLSLFRRQLYKRIGAKLLDFFGGHLQLLAIGGAALNIEVEKFLRDAGFPYLVGYGLTETAPLIAAGPFKGPTITLGSTGKPVSQVEIKIHDPEPESGIGEIYARGPNVMLGYHNNPELTAKTIDKEGWLATGDLGVIDEHGNLTIKGRSKSVIVLSSGENIYPEIIEEKINSEVHVVESLVTENNNQLEAWVYLDYDLIDTETGGKSQQQKFEYIKDILQHIKKSVNQQLPKYSKLARVVEREEPFIKTATHKIKRYLYSKPH